MRLFFFEWVVPFVLLFLLFGIITSVFFFLLGVSLIYAAVTDFVIAASVLGLIKLVQ